MIRSLFYSHYDDEVGFLGFCFVLETGSHCVVLADPELSFVDEDGLEFTDIYICLCLSSAGTTIVYTTVSIRVLFLRQDLTL